MDKNLTIPSLHTPIPSLYTWATQVKGKGFVLDSPTQQTEPVDHFYVFFLSLCHDFSTLGWTHLSSTSDSCIKQLLESPLLCLIGISNQHVPNLTSNLYAKICSTQSQLMATPIFTIAQTKFLEAPLTLLCLSYPTSNPSENYFASNFKICPCLSSPGWVILLVV